VLYPVKKGATTIWEPGWHQPDGSFQDADHELLQPLRYGAIVTGSTVSWPVSTSIRRSLVTSTS